MVGQWEGLLERVRKLNGFEHFLKPIPFCELRQAATTEQVVIINISQYKADALIFSEAGPINHVPLPSIDHEVLTELSGEMLLQRPVVANEKTQKSYTTRYLKPTLQAVWNYILIPIFTSINFPMIHPVTPPQCRFWWYPTGPLTFIPIHAAGPKKGATDVSRLVVSSYVTSLDSLLRAQKRKRQCTIPNFKLLAISQPNTPGLYPLPQSTTEVQTLVDLVSLKGCSEKDIYHFNGSNAVINCVSDALDTCSWVHFSCHGLQESVQGMKSAFALYDGPLELGQIASKRLSTGQFAFLSACHAATGLKNLPGEAMHLAAGMLFAGFPSVIATMWTIRDEDAPKVADQVYQYLFRNGLQGLDPSEAATALNHAVLCLREDPDITVDQWAPFIHFGI